MSRGHEVAGNPTGANRPCHDVFDAQARLLSSSAVLLGSAIGDDSVQGIGTRAISQVAPHQRTTPAGFYESYLRPVMATHRVIIYVLPESKSLQRVFANY